jgi:hypothetical protein
MMREIRDEESVEAAYFNACQEVINTRDVRFLPHETTHFFVVSAAKAILVPSVSL